ncbi:MAG TPA: DUF5777 family beta-barrel protein [Bacteroidales bacterium]|nr:DUF5777 family beta-barrel protein [Bacteroidales bacterium]
MKILKVIIISFVLSATSTAVFSQSLLDSLQSVTPGQESESLQLFKGSLIHNGQSTAQAFPGELKLNIQHRFGNISNGLYDLFGLDVATMRFGFEYGFNDWLSASVGRSTYEKTYDAGIEASLLKQNNTGNKPLDINVFFQVSGNTLRNIYPDEYDNLSGRLAYSGQLLVGRKIGILSLMLSPSFVYNSYDYRIADSFMYYALGSGGSIRINEKVSVTAEYYYSFTDTPFTNYNPLSIGVDLDTGGHLFQLIFSNSTGMFNKSMLVNNTGRWLDGNIYFGFNLIRTFYLTSKNY